jgi:tripartite-type tricarboxylate transporter receptor subunit TctC
MRIEPNMRAAVRHEPGAENAPGPAPLLRRSFLAVVLALLPMAQACAADFPNRALSLIVPFAAGGGTDSLARDLAARLQEKLGQPVVVENRGGAGGAIGAESVARARPDGHTLLFVTSTFVTHAASGERLPYDVQADFSPVALLGRGPLLLVAAQDTGWSTQAQFIEAARKDPGRIAYCSAGPGSINHLAGELFAQTAGVTMIHVPYKGSGPATTDLLAGRVQAFFATVPTILGQVKAKRVRLLAVTGRERSPLFPDAPTVAESGLPGYAVYTWWGVVAPAGTPADVVRALNRAINEASPALARRLVDEGAVPQQGPPEELAATIAQELKGWRALVQRAGLKLNP